MELRKVPSPCTKFDLAHFRTDVWTTSKARKLYRNERRQLTFDIDTLHVRLKFRINSRMFCSAVMLDFDLGSEAAPSREYCAASFSRGFACALSLSRKLRDVLAVRARNETE